MKRKLKGTKSGYIYVIDIGYDSLYKIGLSQRLQRRLTSLTAANPRAKIEMAFLVNNVKKVERFLHKRFDILHFEREVFRLQPENLTWLRKYLHEENNKYIPERRQFQPEEATT